MCWNEHAVLESLRRKQSQVVASQGGAPATEATVGPSDKLEAGRSMRMVFEQLRHEETNDESDWGA